MSETSEDVDRQLVAARRVLSDFEEGVDRHRLILRLRTSSPAHPVLLARVAFALLFFLSLVGAIGVLALTMVSAEFARLLAKFEMVSPLPEDVPLLPAMFALLAMCMALGWVASTLAAQTLGRDAALLRWEQRQHQKLLNDVTRLTTQKAVLERIRNTPAGARPRIATPTPMGVRRSTPGIPTPLLGFSPSTSELSASALAASALASQSSSAPSTSPSALPRIAPGGTPRGAPAQTYPYQQPPTPHGMNTSPLTGASPGAAPLPDGASYTPPSLALARPTPAPTGGVIHNNAGNSGVPGRATPGGLLRRPVPRTPTPAISAPRHAIPTPAPLSPAASLSPEVAASPAAVRTDAEGAVNGSAGSPETPAAKRTAPFAAPEPRTPKAGPRTPLQPIPPVQLQPRKDTATPATLQSTPDAAERNRPAEIPTATVSLTDSGEIDIPGFTDAARAEEAAKAAARVDAASAKARVETPSREAHRPAIVLPPANGAGTAVAEAQAAAQVEADLAITAAAERGGILARTRAGIQRINRPTPFGSAGRIRLPGATAALQVGAGQLMGMTTRGGTPLGAPPKAGVPVGGGATPRIAMRRGEARVSPPGEDRADLAPIGAGVVTAKSMFGTPATVERQLQAAAMPAEVVLEEEEAEDENTLPHDDDDDDDSATRAGYDDAPPVDDAEPWLQQALAKADALARSFPPSVGLEISREPNLPFTLVITRASPAVALRAMVAFVEFLAGIATPPRARVELVGVAHLDRSFHRNVEAALEPYFGRDVEVRPGPGQVDIKFNHPAAPWQAYPRLPQR